MIVRDVFGDRTRLASAQCPPADPAPHDPSAPPSELGICCKGVSGMNSPSVPLRFRDVSFALWGREREQFQLIGLLIARGTVPRHRIGQYRAYEPWLHCHEKVPRRPAPPRATPNPASAYADQQTLATHR